MRRTIVAGAVLALGLLTSALPTAGGTVPPEPGVEVGAAMDMFLDLGPVCGEARDGGPPCPGRQG